MEVALELSDFGMLTFFVGLFAGIILGFIFGVSSEAGRK